MNFPALTVLLHQINAKPVGRNLGNFVKVYPSQKSDTQYEHTENVGKQAILNLAAKSVECRCVSQVR